MNAVQKIDAINSWKEAGIVLSIAFGLATVAAFGAAYSFNMQLGSVVSSIFTGINIG